MKSEHPLFTEHLIINDYMECWTDLIDPSALNHVSALIDKNINCRKLRKVHTRRRHRHGRY